VIPHLFQQTIMFVISTERENFADASYGRAGARFITLVGTADGNVVQLEGEEALKTFQEESESIHQGEAA
jgi:DNA sulfur modification protein DndD